MKLAYYKVYLGLGSNTNQPRQQIKIAIESIKKLSYLHITKISSLYHTKAWGFTKQDDFCNLVLEAYTALSPIALLRKTQEIEEKQGRSKTFKWGPRIIDIDLLIYGELKREYYRKDISLTIPHPFMKDRGFVIMPLLEIAPQLKDFFTIQPSFKKEIIRIESWQ